MITQNVTISQLSLKSNTLMSPIVFLPILSLSSSSLFYFNKISSSHSLSPFINGKKFNFLSIKYSKFSYFLSNVLRIEGEDIPLYLTPVFKLNCDDIHEVINKSIQIIGCGYGRSNGSAIYSVDSDLRVFITTFIGCSGTNGGGIYHVNGYLRTDSNDFVDCKADDYGGAFYHSIGKIKIFRSSFNSNMAKLGGSHFCVDNYTDNTLAMDFCFFSFLTSYDKDTLVCVRHVNQGSKIFIIPRSCRFNFTRQNLLDFINNENTEVLLSPGGTDNNIFNEDGKNFQAETWPMRTLHSNTFTPTAQFSETEVFSETYDFTYSEIFTKSSIFVDSSPFTPSNNFTNTRSFTPSGLFSMTSFFTCTINFTQSDRFTISSGFTASSRFSASFAFTLSSFFSPSNVFTLSESFTPSRSGTPSYSPIPTRSAGPSKTPTSIFTRSNSFTESSVFTASSRFTASSYFTSIQFTPTEFFDARPAPLQATKKALKGDGIMITLIVLGALLLLLGLIANIILCVQMVQAGEIIITQQM